MYALTEKLNKYAADLCDRFNAKNTGAEICFENYSSCGSTGICFKRLENETTIRHAHSGTAFDNFEDGKDAVDDAFFLVVNGFTKSEIAIPDEKTIKKVRPSVELYSPLLTNEGKILNALVVLTDKKKAIHIRLGNICKLTGLTTNYVRHAIQSMKESGMLEIIKDGNRNIYVPNKTAAFWLKSNI